MREALWSACALRRSPMERSDPSSAIDRESHSVACQSGAERRTPKIGCADQDIDKQSVPDVRPSCLSLVPPRRIALDPLDGLLSRPSHPGVGVLAGDLLQQTEQGRPQRCLEWPWGTCLLSRTTGNVASREGAVPGLCKMAGVHASRAREAHSVRRFWAHNRSPVGGRLPPPGFLRGTPDTTPAHQMGK